MSPGSTNRAVNAMRAAAAILVVISHLRALFFVDYDGAGGPVAKLFYAVTGLGHQAVMVFFVLSGYWVGGGVLVRMRRADFAWRDYALSRLTRLWLVAVPAIVLTAVVDRVGRGLTSSDVYQGSTAYHSEVPVHLDQVSTWPVALSNVFFLQHIHSPTFGTNTALWSLAYEFWYYLIFAAACLAFVAWASPARRVAAAIIALVGCAIAGPQVLALFVPWLVGAAVAGWRQPLQRRVPSGGALQILATVFCTGCLLATRFVGGGQPMLVALSTLGSVSLLVTLLSDASSGGPIEVVLNGSSWYAERSYSLYAIHFPLVVLAAAFIIPRAGSRWEFSYVHLAAGTVVLVAVMTIAAGFAALTEVRTDATRRALRRRLMQTA